MKKTGVILIILVACAFILQGCGGSSSGTTYNPGSNTTTPTITSCSLAGQSVAAGASCSLAGTGFGATNTGTRTTYASYIELFPNNASTPLKVPDSNIVSWSDTAIVFIIPSTVVNGITYTINVVKVVDGSSSSSSSSSSASSNVTPTQPTVTPAISGISPSGQSAGGTITISGTNFGTSGYVTFGSMSQYTATFSGGTQVTCAIPTGISGSVSVVVFSNQNGASSGYSYTVGGSSSGYTISGSIRDLMTTSAISGASITLTGQSSSGGTSTDSNGNFSFPANPAGNYVMRVTSSQYVTMNYYISLSANKTVNNSLVKLSDWNTLMGDTSHPYDASSGYIAFWVGTSSGSGGLQGITFSLSPSTYTALAYMNNATNQMGTMNFTATSTMSNGNGMFYKVTPGSSYTLTGTGSGYTTQVGGAVSTAGEISMYELYASGGSSGNNVSGNLKDVMTGTAISGASVTLTVNGGSSQVSTTTDSSGNFSFSNITAGDYILRFSSSGYVPLNKYLNIQGNVSQYTSICKITDWNTLMGSSHPYDASSGYFLVNVWTIQSQMLQGAVVICTPGGTAMAYVTSGTPPTLDWSGTSTTQGGSAFIYKVSTTQTYSLTAQKTGYTFGSISGIVPIAGEISDYDLQSTNQ
ncbi:MAG: carboxypeptidase regulatory-like domain-containing protein [Candidatus Eremiobacteraeota bacterium]|nr:carboxypeptidase regulatory-like domain-containing protein [Candidatus Eremiobacteraeota bacterium]